MYHVTPRATAWERPDPRAAAGSQGRKAGRTGSAMAGGLALLVVRPALEGKERGRGTRFVYRLDSGCAVETMATAGFLKPERAGGLGRTPIGRGFR